MANTTNSRISTLVSSQVPFFVRNDHQTFVRFVEAYYEYLEQTGKTVERAKGLPEYHDVDTTIDEFVDHFHKNFLSLLPKDHIVDQGYIIKHIKDFYRARGTEKAVRFLMRLVYNKETDFYYPQRDVLRASAGNWYIEKSIKVSDILVNGSANNDSRIIEKFIGRRIVGSTSGAFALVEKVDEYYDAGTFVQELKLSGQYRDFDDGEIIVSTFNENGSEIPIAANLYSGIVNSITLVSGGTNYQVGDVIPVDSNTGTGATIVVSAVSTGNIQAIAVIRGGAGFQVNNQLLITSASGSGATGNVLTILADGSAHANSYNVNWETVGMFANTTLDSGNLFTVGANANSTIGDALSTFVYANTGPIDSAFIYTAGQGYSVPPTIAAQANSRIRALGILGTMTINDGGSGYEIGDVLVFTNVLGGYGTGANAIVSNVSTGNAISKVEFVSDGAEVPGGVGYDMGFLPTVSVVSANANAYGANIVVTAILGAGDYLSPITSSIGTIQSLTLTSGGSGYTSVPTINLTSKGDGTAQATATIITGTYTYPGRYINDDGHLSGYNFLEDKDYYQPFSYVVKLNESIEAYRKILKDLIHPAGMKIFGEYTSVDESVDGNVIIQGANTTYSTNNYIGTYEATANATNTTITITTGHDTTGMINVYVEFDTANLSNTIYTANVVNTTTFQVYHAIAANGSGNVYFTRT